MDHVFTGAAVDFTILLMGPQDPIASGHAHIIGSITALVSTAVPALTHPLSGEMCLSALSLAIPPHTTTPMEPALLHALPLIFKEFPAISPVFVNSRVHQALIISTRINLALQISADILILSLEIKAWTSFVTQSVFQQNLFTQTAHVS